MNRKTIAFNLIVLIGIVSSFIFNPMNAQAGYNERENQKSIMLGSAVEFRWDARERVGQPHESLGTKISANTVLTHNHFSDLAGTHIYDPGNSKRPHGVSNTTRTTPFGRTLRSGAQTRLVYSEVKYSGSFAPIASQRTIKRLRVGDSVDVVYWDDARSKIAVAKFQIKAFKDGSVIVLNDPTNIINGGDSGGGVFYNGKLIGNTWRYRAILDRQGNLLGKEVDVQVVPAELLQVIGQW